VLELDGYMNPKWNKQYRVILVIVDNPKNGILQLFPEYFFICTNWPAESLPPPLCLEHYRQRGTFEDRIGEWNALDVNLSLDDYAKNEVTLLLSLLAFNFLEIIRSEIESARDPRSNPPYTPDESGWDMNRLRNSSLKTGSILSHSGRRLWFALAIGLAPLWLAFTNRINRWKSVVKEHAHFNKPQRPKFMPLPIHAFPSYFPRL
jgi:hypothetical protein